MRKTIEIAQFAVLAAILSACGGSVSENPPAALNIPDRAGTDQSVTSAFGPLIVHEGEFDESADKVPWSGSWLPLKSTALFESTDGSLAPLQKYDLYMARVHGQKTRSAETERDNPELYDPTALGWEGRCDAWATASVLEAEPTKPVVAAGITFTVGDLKDLLIKTYENSHALKQYGRNFGPGPDADFNQIYPDQFHRAVQREIFENHRLLVFDNDPTEQVWNTPMYRAMFDIEGDAHDEHVMHVTAFIWGVSPFIPQPDYVGTITVKYIYTYDLFGSRTSDGGFQVAYGEWTGDSRTEHPNFVSIITHDLAHSSNNPEISTDVVNEILHQSL